MKIHIYLIKKKIMYKLTDDAQKIKKRHPRIVVGRMLKPLETHGRNKFSKKVSGILNSF